MAVRLLVSFNKEDGRDWAALEKMLGVPAGTGWEADKLEKRIDNLRREGRTEEATAVSREASGSDAHRLYTFTFMGWGAHHRRGPQGHQVVRAAHRRRPHRPPGADTGHPALPGSERESPSGHRRAPHDPHLRVTPNTWVANPEPATKRSA